MASRVNLVWKMITLSLLVAACTTTPGDAVESTVGGSLQSESTVVQTPEAVETGFGESSVLSGLVEAGELPSVEERLPIEPYVVQSGDVVPADVLELEIGSYGGTLSLTQNAFGVSMFEPLLWAPGGWRMDEGIEGNVLAGWDVNEDDTVFTFYLREGLHWSDGVPVTMEDVRFAVDDVLFNEQLTPVLPTFLRSGNSADGAPFEFEVLDDWTFTVSFDAPYGSFPGQLVISNFRTWEPFIKPAHYLSEFHEDYANPDELAALLAEEGLAEDAWVTLFNSRTLTEGNAGGTMLATGPQAAGHPVLSPWMMVDATEEVFLYERNPYYFKVDEAGNQLPYIDEVRASTEGDPETVISRALFGEFDYLGEGATFRQFPLMLEREEEGAIKVMVARQHTAPLTIHFNMTNPDEKWQELAGDVRFRRALSYAIDRQEVIDNFYLGQFAELPSRVNDDVRNPEEANRLLDEMGLDAVDDDGCRVGPDGEAINFRFEAFAWSEAHVPVTELVAEHWRDVGVCVTPQTITDIGTVLVDNSLQANLMFNALPGWQIAQWDDYLPIYWSIPWHQWYTSQGAEGVEPPDEFKELFDLHEQLLAASIGSEEANAAYEAILQSYRENVWSVQIVEEAQQPTFVTTRVHNVPVGMDIQIPSIMVAYSMPHWYLEE